MKKSRTFEENKKYWQAHIETYKKSGLSQREYCREKGISYWSFSPWKRKIERRSNKPQEIPLSLVQSMSSIDKGIELIVEDKIRISVPDRFSEETLRNVLNILGVKR